MKLNGVEIDRQQSERVNNPTKKASDRFINTVLGVCALISISAFVFLFYVVVSPYQSFTLRTEQISLDKQALSDGTTYLVVDYHFTDYGGSGERQALSFHDAKRKFWDHDYYPNGGTGIVIEDESVEPYVEVEVRQNGKANPITGEMLSIPWLIKEPKEYYVPMTVHVHASDVLTLSDGAIEKRALKQRRTITDGTHCLATKNGSRYIFNIEERSYDFIQGDFFGELGDDFEVVILDNPDEPAYVEGKLQVTRGRSYVLPDEEDGSGRIHAVFIPKTLYVHEGDILEAPQIYVDLEDLSAPNDDPGPGPSANININV